MKKLLAVFSLVIVVSMVLSACGAAGGEEQAGESEPLRVWIQWGDNPQQIQALFDKYTAETGIKVEVTAPLEDDKILPALTGSTPPDILVLSGGDAAKSFYAEGLVEELSGAIKTGNIDMEDMFDAPLANASRATRSSASPGARMLMHYSGTRTCLKLRAWIPKNRPQPWKNWSKWLTS